MIIKPCPFCGHSALKYNLIDSLHPTGMKWFKSPSLDVQYFDKDIGFIHFDQKPLTVVLESQITESGAVWEFCCLVTEGGCGVSMTALSEEEVLRKWNTRV